MLPSDLDPKITACFTGHRPDRLGGYDEQNVIAVTTKRALLLMIEQAKEAGYRNFVSGMALGLDIWAAELVLADPSLQLVAAVPCPGQAAKWREDSRRRYQAALERAVHVEVIAPEYSAAAMHRRNHWMVERSSLVLAVWNGAKDGGTFSCLAYAAKQEREIIRFNPVSLDFEKVEF